jgi:hypothetical protein
VSLQKTDPKKKRVVEIIDVLTLLYFDLLLILTLIGPSLGWKNFPSLGLVLVSTGANLVILTFAREWCYQRGLDKAFWVSCKKDWILLLCTWLIVFYRFTGWSWAVYLNWITVVAFVLIRLIFMPWMGYGRRVRLVQVRRGI